MTENELIPALRERDEYAFRELVNSYQDRVYNTALGLLQHPADAEDMAQEVFIQVYRSIHDFKQQSRLSTWIYRITVTKCLDHLRSRKRKKRFGVMSRLFGDNNQPLHEPTDFHHPGIRTESREEAAMLFQLINKLPETQKTVFILNKVEELSYREIAEIVGSTEKAVDALLQRAKLNLRKYIGSPP